MPSFIDRFELPKSDSIDDVSLIDFGPDQVIIVWKEESKSKLPAKI